MSVVSSSTGKSKYKYPKIRIDERVDEAKLLSLKLCKAGYGSSEEILNTKADLVLMMLHYESFLTDYEQEFFRLNSGDSE